MKLNLRNLEAFRAVIAHGTATQAARILNISQPAVSQMINQLEESIGCPLFYRHKGRLNPTPKGLMFYEEVDLAFGRLDHLVRLAESMDSLEVGHLRVVAPPSLAEGLLSTVVAKFLAKRPSVRMSVDARSPDSARELVAGQTYDCGIGKLPLDHPGLEFEPFVTSETVCALPQGHRLCASERITADQLADQALILLGKGRTSRSRIEHAFAQAGVRPLVRLETHTVGAACAFAAAGVGIAVVNGLMAFQYLGRGIELRLFEPSISHEFVFMMPSAAPRRLLMRDFFKTTREILSQQPNRHIRIQPSSSRGD